MRETPVKTCSKCGETKPLSKFNLGRGWKDGYNPRCRACHRAYRLRKEFGITPAEYDGMLTAQGGGCALCGKTPEENGKRLAVDHDHTTGAVRGLLCHNCNTALGSLGHSPELCELAARYLRRQGVDYAKA